MKKIFYGGLKFGAVVTACAFFAGEALAQNDFPQDATVIRLEGQARISTDHVKWHKLAKGSIISPGSLVQTSDNTVLDIALDKSATGNFNAQTDKLGAGTVRVLGNSVVGFDRLSSQRTGDALVEDIQLDLQVGEIAGLTGKPAAGSKYEIKFAHGMVGIQGAKYQMNAAGMVRAFTGQAVVASVAADGSTPVTVVTAGNQFDPAIGAASPISGAMPGQGLEPNPKAVAPSPAATENTQSPDYKPPGALHPLRKF